ncbi:MAG: hypothetical protein ACJA2W_001092 [Planctomycetota bacterium]|jgi:hypothetical protein
MLNPRLVAALSILAVFAPVAAPAAQVGSTEPEAASARPVQFAAGTEAGGAPITYFGEEARDGRLTLTAWNGFFDSRSFVARGARPAPDAEKPLIAKHFDYLQPGKAPGPARWHVWTEAAGTLEVAVYLDVPQSDAQSDAQLDAQLDAQSDAGAQWRVECDEQQQRFTAQVSDGSAPQSVRLRFTVAPGKHTIALGPADSAAAAGTKVLRVELTGKAAHRAKLLRVRWRPAAAHTSYSSTTCEKSTMWVFESRSLTGASSYSPINTPFGYFGTTFDPSREKPRGFNFSMWATGKGKAVPALTDMPHLIATGHPLADFSGFGHEGSGVKLRGWDCLDWDPDSVVQALRMERRGDRDYFFGYFYHEPKEQWMLYAAGARPPRRKNAPLEFSRVTAFCEVPGPPDRQRSGDVERRIARRGWFHGAGGQWHPADVHSCKDEQSSSARRVGPAEDGWHVSIAGGMEIIDAPGTQALPKPHAAAQHLPEYLRADKVDQLFSVPVQFESHSVLDLGRTSATVQYDLQGLGKDASAMLYFGTVDCLTFVARELHGTEKKGASADFYTGERTWAQRTESVPIENGAHGFQLKDLEPDTAYYYRAFVTHQDGKSWSYDSGTFKTRP